MTSDPWVLGLAASHNGAACLLKGDRIVVAVQEERLVRSKRARLFGAASSFAEQYCLRAAGITAADLGKVVLCSQTGNRKPENDVMFNEALRLHAAGVPLSYLSHHRGHAVGAFATSGFTEAAILVVDGVGSFLEDVTAEERAAVLGDHDDRAGETISLYHATRDSLRAIEKHAIKDALWVERCEHRMRKFGSLGGMYGSVGHQVFGDTMDGAGKVMGLAPYGTPDTPSADFFEIKDGQFVWKDTVPRRHEHDRRWPNLQPEYSNLAASVQRALEEALLYLVRRLRERTRSENLCLVGGVALNSVANERIIREAGFKNVFIMPAAEDSGTAIGAAYQGLWELTGQQRTRKLLHDTVGRVYGEAEIDAAIAASPAVQASRSSDPIADTVRLLVEGKIVGWFDGGSELGPRSLGQRSILCDPRGPHVKDTLNARVKHREGFRPFAPIIPLEHIGDWFDLEGSPPESPFMLRVMRFKEDKRNVVPGVVHVDGTGRIQTLTAEANGRLYELARRFHAETGVPILLNTSFNVAGEPIVETPEDALWCLIFTGVDVCVLGDRIVHKRAGYQSVLELYPRVAAEWISLSRKVQEGRIDFTRPVPPTKLPFETPFGTAAASSGYLERMATAMVPEIVKFRVHTPFGAADYFSEASLLELVQRADGKRTGAQLLADLRAAGHDVTDAHFTRQIGRLRRTRVISLHEQPVVPAATAGGSP